MPSHPPTCAANPQPHPGPRRAVPDFQQREPSSGSLFLFAGSPRRVIVRQCDAGIGLPQAVQPAAKWAGANVAPAREPYGTYEEGAPGVLYRARRRIGGSAGTGAYGLDSRALRIFLPNDALQSADSPS